MDFCVVDAFAARPFAGNPAAVVPLDRDMNDTMRQAIAAEFNHAETAFTQARADGRFDLCWFTPTREVPLCGHATLAAAHALWEMGLAKRAEAIRFVTRVSGELICVPRGERYIQMDFPATPAAPAALPDNAAALLGVSCPVSVVGTTAMNLTLRLASAENVRRCKPDLHAISKWHPTGVTVTAPGDEGGVDFVSRFFAPQSGVPEDPVTGSAHCTLAPYWASVLGKNTFVARQLSKRGGELAVELHGSRVHLIGQAITTMRGELLL